MTPPRIERRTPPISLHPEEPVVAPAPRAGFGPRVATALVLAPLAMLAVWAGGRLYAAVIAAMTVFLIFEWTRLVRGAEFGRGFYALSATAIVAVALAASGRFGAALIALVVGGGAAMLLEWPRRNPDSWPAVGAGYLIGPAIACLWIRQLEAGLVLTVLLFVVVWGADSGAYIVGKNVGGPKLAPRISPGKTWSGAVGGVVTGALIALGIAALGGFGRPLFWLGAGLVLAVASVLGDLAESQLKRSYGVKDSGSAFPGHGGVLDRLDGFLFASAALAGLLLLGAV